MVDSSLIEKRTAFIQAIRDYCRSQVETWTQVPWLALQTDGRDGGMGFYRSAYENAYWELHIPNWPHRRIFVACDTGDILGAGSPGLSLASDDLVLMLGNHLEKLDAAATCEKLRQKAQGERPTYISVEETGKRERQRISIATSLSLGETYVRRSRRVAA